MKNLQSTTDNLQLKTIRLVKMVKKNRFTVVGSRLSVVCGGFTLMELMVAMTIFIILMVIVSGGFVNAIKTQRSMTQLMSVNNNASLVLEQMVREIRTGYGFTLNDQGGGCSNRLEFINFASNTVVYSLSEDRVWRSEAAAPAQALTATNVDIERLCFVSTPAVRESEDIFPWRITILLRVGARDNLGENSALNVQTTVSPRILPLDV